MPDTPILPNGIKPNLGHPPLLIAMPLGLSAQERLHLTDLFRHLSQLIPLLNRYLLAKRLAEGLEKGAVRHNRERLVVL